MTAPDIAAIKARLDVATRGPWEAVEDEDSPGGFLVLSDPDPDTKTNLVAQSGADDHWKGWANVEFIAHAREDIPALLSLVEQQKAEIERLKTACPCHERAMQTLGDQRVAVTAQSATQFGGLLCSKCGRQMSLRMWNRPGGPPGNGWGCDTCNPLPDPPADVGKGE